MNQTLDNIGKNRTYDWHYYVTLMAFVVTGPVLLSVYAFAAWCLAASIDLIHSFPWSSGPLSNWMIWLTVAVILNLIATNFKRLNESSVPSNQQ